MVIDDEAFPDKTPNRDREECPIKEIYERFNHLDKLFSDPIWLGIDGEDTDGQGIRASCYEMWKAIKLFSTRKPAVEHGESKVNKVKENA